MIRIALKMAKDYRYAVNKTITCSFAISVGNTFWPALVSVPFVYVTLILKPFAVKAVTASGERQTLRSLDRSFGIPITNVNTKPICGKSSNTSCNYT